MQEGRILAAEGSLSANGLQSKINHFVGIRYQDPLEEQ